VQFFYTLHVMHFRILKMIAISGFLTALECTKFLQRSPRTPSWFKGAYFYGEGRKRDRKGKKGRGVRGRGRGETGNGGMEGKGQGCQGKGREGEEGRKKSKNIPSVNSCLRPCLTRVQHALRMGQPL